MTAVTVTFDMKFKPGIAEMMIANLPAMLEETASRPGFRSIQVVRADNDADRLLLIEQWDSEADYRAYRAWRAEQGQGAADFLREPAEAEIWSLPLITR